MSKIGVHLNKIFYWEDKVQNVLIEDVVDQSCSWMVSGLAVSALKKNFGVIFLTFEHIISQLSQTYPWNSAQLSVLDGYQSLDPQNICSTLDLIELNKRINSEYEALLSSGCKKVIIMIDSVNSLFGLSDETKIFPFLKSLSTLVSGNLVLVFHGDVSVSDNHAGLSNFKKNLDFLCGTYLTLNNSTKKREMDRSFIDDAEYLEFYPEVNKPDTFLVDLVHQQSSGVVARELSIVQINFESNDCSFEFSSYLDPLAEDIVENQNLNHNNQTNASKPDAAVDSIAASLSDVSFNLHLTDKQREAKDSLVLPYLAGANKVAGGTIHYHPDDRDDFDEDDPDDDLEI